MSSIAQRVHSIDGKTASLADDLLFGWVLNTDCPNPPTERAPLIDEAVVKLASIASMRSLSDDETLYVEGDRIERCYEVLSGCLRRVSILPDGRRHVVTFLHRGDLLGVGPEQTYPHTVEAVGNARLLSFPRKAFFQIAQDNPALRSAITGALARKVRRTTDHFRTVACFSAVDRVAAFLLDYSQEHASLCAHQNQATPANDRSIILPMPRRDLADHLGLSLETVCRAITRLRKCQLIVMPEPHRFCIPSRAKLEAFILDDEAA